MKFKNEFFSSIFMASMSRFEGKWKLLWLKQVQANWNIENKHISTDLNWTCYNLLNKNLDHSGLAEYYFLILKWTGLYQAGSHLRVFLPATLSRCPRPSCPGRTQGWCLTGSWSKIFINVSQIIIQEKVTLTLYWSYCVLEITYIMMS